MPVDPAIQDELDRILGISGSGTVGMGPTSGGPAQTTGQGSNVAYPGANTGGTNVTDADRALSGANGTPTPAMAQAQMDMVDAIATGNREKFEQAKRQYEQSLAEQKRQFDVGRGDSQRRLFMEMFGYDPGQASQPQAAPSTGGYTTKNGPKSVEEMRAELKTAGFPNWQQAGETEIVEVYARTTGGPVTAGSGTAPSGAGQAAPINAGVGQRLLQIYESVRAKKGVPALPPTDPDLLRAVTAELGFTPQQAQQLLQAGKDYYEAHGQIIPDNVVQATVDRVRPFGDKPTMDARTFEEKNRDDERDFAEEQRQYDQSEYSGMAKAILSASSQMRGPRDYAQYQKMLGGGRDILEQLSGSTPQAGFGMTGDPERARITDVLEKLGLNSRALGGPAMAGVR